MSSDKIVKNTSKRKMPQTVKQTRTIIKEAIVKVQNELGLNYGGMECKDDFSLISLLKHRHSRIDFNPSREVEGARRLLQIVSSKIRGENNWLIKRVFDSSTSFEKQRTGNDATEIISLTIMPDQIRRGGESSSALNEKSNTELTTRIADKMTHDKINELIIDYTRTENPIVLKTPSIEIARLNKKQSHRLPEKQFSATEINNTAVVIPADVLQSTKALHEKSFKAGVNFDNETPPTSTALAAEIAIFYDLPKAVQQQTAPKPQQKPLTSPIPQIELSAVFSKVYVFPQELIVMIVSHLTFQQRVLFLSVSRAWKSLENIFSTWKGFESPKFNYLLSKVPKGCIKELKFDCDQTFQVQNETCKQLKLYGHENFNNLVLNGDSISRKALQFLQPMQCQTLSVLLRHQNHILTDPYGLPMALDMPPVHLKHLSLKTSQLCLCPFWNTARNLVSVVASVFAPNSVQLEIFYIQKSLTRLELTFDSPAMEHNVKLVDMILSKVPNLEVLHLKSNSGLVLSKFPSLSPRVRLLNLKELVLTHFQLSLENIGDLICRTNLEVMKRFSLMECAKLGTVDVCGGEVMLIADPIGVTAFGKQDVFALLPNSEVLLISSVYEW